MRRIGGRQDGDVGLLGGAVTAVSYQITDVQGNAIGPGVIDTPLTAQIKNNTAWYEAYAAKSIMTPRCVVIHALVRGRRH